MVTVFRGDGLRVVIFVSDHAPAHVHVFGDGHAKINLTGANGMPELIFVEGMKRNEARRAMQLVVDRQDELCARWRELHG